MLAPTVLKHALLHVRPGRSTAFEAAHHFDDPFPAVEHVTEVQRA